MHNYESFLASLTEEKYKEIIEGPIGKDQKYFFEGYAPSTASMYNDEKSLERYVNNTAVNSVIRFLRAYDEFLQDNK